MICCYLILTVISMTSISANVQTTRQDESRCGFPTHIDMLPEFAIKQLKIIWKNYTGNDSCEKELLATQDVIALVDHYNYHSKNKKGPLTYSKEASHSPLSTQYLEENVNEFHLKNSSMEKILTVSDKAGPIYVPASSIAKEYTVDVQNDDYLDEVSKALPYEAENTEYMRNNNGVKLTDEEIEYPVEDIFREVQDQEEKLREENKFLRNLNGETARKFHELLNDPNIPSESLRSEKVHLLAVSSLTPDELVAYNAYATSIRDQIDFLRTQLRGLSREARAAVHMVAVAEPSEREFLTRNLSLDVRSQLKALTARLRRRAL